jgi:hypothetical protein
MFAFKHLLIIPLVPPMPSEREHSEGSLFLRIEAAVAG